MLLNLIFLFHKIHHLLATFLKNNKKKISLLPFFLVLFIYAPLFTNEGIAQESKEKSGESQKKSSEKSISKKNNFKEKEPKAGASKSQDATDAPTSKEVADSIKDQVTAWSKGVGAQKDLSPTAIPQKTSETSQAPSPAEQNTTEQPQSSKKISTHLTTGLTKDGSLKLDLYFKLGTPFFSIFSRDKTCYIVLSHPSDFEQDSYNAHDFGNLEGIYTLDIERGLVIKVVFKNRQFPTIEYDEKQDTIHLLFSNKPPIEERGDDIVLPKNNDKSFRVKQDNGRIDLDFYDDDSTHLWAICASGENLPLRYHHYPEFNILESYQGLAFELISDELTTQFSNRKATITREDGLAVSPERSADELEQKATSLFMDFDSKSAPEEVIRLSQLVVTRPQPIREYFEMIFFYVGLYRVPEAIAIVNRLKESFSDIQLIPAFRAMEGLCQLFLDRCSKAEEVLEPLSYDPESKFWRTLAQVTKNYFLSSVESRHLPKFSKGLLLMPQSLRDSLLIKILLTGIHQRDDDILQVYTEPSFLPKSPIAMGYYKLAKVVSHLIQDQNYPLKELEDFKKFTFDPKIPVIAEFELIKLNPTASDQDPSAEFRNLEALCYRWRGDILEYQINAYLASRYLERKKYHLALPIYRRLIKYYEKNSHEDNLPQKMKTALISYFKQDPFPPILEALSVFQDYGDNAPNSEEGDDMILRATNPMVQLDLYEEALDIIKKYLESKCQEDATEDSSRVQHRKNNLLYRMGVIHFLNNQPKESLDVLNRIKDPKPSVHQEANLLKAECYNDLKKLPEALAVLEDTPNELIRKGALYFTHEKWEEAAVVYSQILDIREKDIEAVPLELTQTVLLDLAICYASLKQVDQLKQLKDKYLSVIKDSKIHSALEFLTTDLSFDNIHEISGSKLSEITQVKSYADNLKKIF